jgi:hypothetical protein
MSGFWSMENVPEFEGLWVDISDDQWEPLSPTRETSAGKRQRLNAVSTNLIYILAAIGIGEITAENVSEVFIRIRMLEIAAGSGTLINEAGDNVMLTLKDIRRHIGMRVGADVDFPPFEKQLVSHLRSQAKEALKRETESLTSTGPSSK